MSCEVIMKCGNIVETLTKEEILSSIAQATGQTDASIDVDEAFISKVKEVNNGKTFKVWAGTYAEFNAIEVKDDATLYIIQEEGESRLVCGVYPFEIVKTGNTFNGAVEAKLMEGDQEITPVVQVDSVKNADGSKFVDTYNSHDHDDTYMKKTADSDLAMQGYCIKKVAKITGNNPIGNESIHIPLPILSSDSFGLDSSATYEEFFTAYLKAIFEQYVGNTLISFSGTVNIVGKGYGHISGCLSTYATHIDSDGNPITFSFVFTLSNGDILLGDRAGASDTFSLRQISSFPYGDTTRDNRINAMGSNSDGSQKYIRYENGIQEVWGEFNISSAVTANTMQNLYPNIPFAQPFKNTTGTNVSISSQGNYNCAIYNVKFTATQINQLEISRLTTIDDSATFRFKFFAIGMWK